MNTLKNVGNKLFKVELENHNIELATIDNLKKSKKLICIVILNQN
jgi:translation initiation factor IF-1